LSLIPGLGRPKRDVMMPVVKTKTALAASEVSDYLEPKNKKKSVFPGVGPASLEKFVARARLLTDKGAKPFLRIPVKLPIAEKELFFDIEVDPLRDVCYLHGFVERVNGPGGAERFIHFFAETPTPEAERRAFRAAWSYLKSAQPAALYFYSKYERTWYRKLQQLYPDVCGKEDIESMFASPLAFDLYTDAVIKATEWPTVDQSIKTIAKYLGFAWRDTHPSGAASIEWFDRWVKTQDPAVKQRILDYNHDDCRATRVLLDGVRALAQ
jgi:predicted RecB family nuclease